MLLIQEIDSKIIFHILGFCEENETIYMFINKCMLLKLTMTVKENKLSHFGGFVRKMKQQYSFWAFQRKCMNFCCCFITILAFTGPML